METRGRQTDEDIAVGNVAHSGQKVLPLDCTDSETGEVVLAGGIKAGHLCCLASCREDWHKELANHIAFRGLSGSFLKFDTIAVTTKAYH